MKKLTAALLLGAVLAGLLTGCGGETAPASSAEAAAASVSETAPEPASPSQPEATPEPAASAEASMAEPAPEAESAPEPSAVEEEPAEPDPEALFRDYWDEPAPAELYAQVADQFQQLAYTDAETGLTIPYNLFVPAAAETEPCPMVMFIGDATCAGADLSFSLSQGYGGIIWATEQEQAKHPSYVLVPVFPEIVIDDNGAPYVSDYVEAAARMVEAVAAENNVDTDRIYTTGQSMGCMTSLYLAAHHPDLFAAELFVSGQWDTAELQGLETQTFFYVAAGGDMKASQGQADVMADLDAKGVPYSASYDWDATQSDKALEPQLRSALEEGPSIHFGQFAAGTVIQANPRGIEHMSSFDCAYRLDVLRNWLFAQSK